jgi:ketosteroid isomerase-like protein
VTTDDVPAVLAAEDRRYQAMLDGDLEALDALCADELSYTHSNGVRDTKAEYFGKLREG